MTWPMLLGLGLAVLVGAVAMRATGMGFALIAAPFLILALGPVQGILVANTCGAVSSLLNLTQVHADIDWKRARVFIPAGIIGSTPGAIAVAMMPTAVLATVVSVIVLAALAVTVLSARFRLPNTTTVAVGAGLASGFMNVTAGVAGAGLVVYALATKWKHASFAATAQLIFVVLSAVALLMKWALPDLSAVGWLVLAVALGLGLVAGNALARRIDPTIAMRLVILIATLGAVMALIQGIVAL